MVKMVIARVSVMDLLWQRVPFEWKILTFTFIDRQLQHAIDLKSEITHFLQTKIIENYFWYKHIYSDIYY